MTKSMPESRTISTIRTGTKVAVLVGVCLIAVAAYFYFTPVYLIKPEGGVFVCGSPSAPNSEAGNVCSSPEKTSRARAFLALGMGILIIVLGFALFGMKKVENHGAVIGDDEDEDADDTRGGHAEATRSGRGDETRGGRADEDRREVDDEDEDEPVTRRSSRHGQRRRRGDDDWSSDGWR